MSSYCYGNLAYKICNFYTNFQITIMLKFIVLSFSQSMELIGGNEIKLPPLKTENMSYVFPNKVSSYGTPLVGDVFFDS